MEYILRGSCGKIFEKINLKDYFPNEIVCKFSYSLETYKKNFKNLKIYLDRNTKKKKKKKN